MDFSSYLARWHAHRATWMERPQEWIWLTPDLKSRQGFGMNWRDTNVGANLLWLALDMSTPPQIYDIRSNQLYMMLVIHGPYMRLNGVDLFDQAASLTLEQFRNECEGGRLEGQFPLARFLPVLTLLASRRLANAHLG